MSNIWFLSDHHFNHHNILKFTKSDGTPIRPGFTDIHHMNEVLIQRHNEVVKPSDKVYFGGDVGRNFNNILSRMNGNKRLILGNHDDKQRLSEYIPHFEKITSWRFFGEYRHKFVLCHYPLHPMSFEYKGGGGAFCVHGHIHEKVVLLEKNLPDYRYINICVEHHDSRPIHIDDLLKIMDKRRAQNPCQPT